MFDRDKPFNDLPLLPPKVELETKNVLKKAISANKQLSELKGLANTIPNQNILVNFLTLQEARTSSEVENIVTTNDKLFEAFSLAAENVDSSTKEVLRYREALWEGFQSLEKRHVLTTNLFIKVCNLIKKNRAGVRTMPGTKIANPKTGKSIYSPPEGEEVILSMLKNLEEFIHDEDDGIDVLVKLAIIHYQFEAIHPFPDGNGRTGRIINVLFLVLKGALDLPILYLSQYIIENKENYYKCLRQVTEKNEWEKWIMFILDSIEATAHSTRNKIIQINNLFEHSLDYARKNLPAHMYSKELIELLFEQPYCKVKFLIEKDIAKRQQASLYLNKLKSVGMLRQKKVGRENLFLNWKLFELLTSSTTVKKKSKREILNQELFETSDSSLENWEEMFAQLEQFIQKYDHSNVSRHNSKTKRLGRWVTNQRQNRKNNLLSREQVARLEKIDFDWEPAKNRWEKNFKELVKFMEANGHCEVSKKIEYKLGCWVQNQRYSYKISKLSSMKIKKLEKISFTWGSDISPWNERFDELIEYQKKHKHLNVSQVDPIEEYRTLGKWLNDQRHFKKKGRLDPEREAKLNEIGIAWSVREAWWEKNLVELKLFYEKNGHFRVPQRGEQSKLGFWIAKIRKVKPSPDRLKKLKAIGFEWGRNGK